MCYLITFISKDLLSPKNEVFIENEKRKITEKYKYKFRLYDGDGILYFEGISKVNQTFEPLDDFGEAYGCTEIRYLEKNKYISL